MTPTGLLVIDKPAGITSHGVVAVVRRTLGTRKVGHAGTLDPMATGVLIVGVGRATRLLGHLALHDKSYLATIRLGATTLTDDREGEVLEVADRATIAAITDAQITKQVAALTGDLLQVPTSISAIKVDGQRAYTLVRSGADVELAARPVHVESFDVLIIRRLPDSIDLDVSVSCSTGTYVRALARDLGRALGIGGHLTALRRTRVGDWTETEAVALDDLRADEDPARFLRPLGEVAQRSFPVVTLDPARSEDVRHGRRTTWPGGPSPVALMDESGRLLALAEQRGDEAAYLAVFAD